MKRLNNKGSVNVWLIGFIVVTLLFLGAAGFGVWAFMGRQDYKDNVDQKIETAVTASNAELTTKKEAEFLEREKQPLRTYAGPEASGSLTIKYPKTWSVYADESGKSGRPLAGYMHPKFVPGLNSGNNYAMRFEVVDKDYAKEVLALASYVKKGTVRATPYTSKSDPSNVGTRYDGEIANKVQGALILLPLRDKTIKIWTEATQFVPDYNKIIVPNFTYKP
ncbi:hypothetical protein KC946_00805 [Candidatus Saccharibacteria bacterium]|nr:hypothetical protein [Candidatus Saccharibacteria bacterium]